MTLTFSRVGIFVGINTKRKNISLSFQEVERLFDSGPGTITESIDVNRRLFFCLNPGSTPLSGDQGIHHTRLITPFQPH